MLLTMIGIVGGCISYSMTNYTTSIKLSFLPRSMDLVHCILPSRRIQPLQDNEEDSGRQIESNS